MATARGTSPIYLDREDEGSGKTSVTIRRRGGKRIVFGWYGGKFSHLDWLLPL
jgi:DNA adenine methylase